MLPNLGALTLFKLLLLEGRIVVFSKDSHKLSSYLYSMLGMFPGLLSFKFKGTLKVIKQ